MESGHNNVRVWNTPVLENDEHMNGNLALGNGICNLLPITRIKYGIGVGIGIRRGNLDLLDCEFTHEKIYEIYTTI